MHEHSHHGHHHAGKDDASQQALKKALGLTIVFLIIELIGGWLANSLALMADAAHMFTDVGSLLLSLTAFWIARRPHSRLMSYGYYRAEILGALASGLALFAVSFWLIYEAIGRLISPPSVKGPAILFVALAGLVVNLITMRLLKSSQTSNINTRGAYLHVIGDLLGSIGTLIAGAIIWATGWVVMDPLITILFTGVIFFSAWRLIKEALAILMEGTPPSVDLSGINRDLRSIPGVEGVHDLHVWTISSGRLVLSAHLISRKSDTVLKRAHQLLKANHSIAHTTIQIEDPDQFQSEHCFDCTPKQ